MDITKENFKHNFANLVFLAGRAQYIALDLEMTGISTRRSHERRAQTLQEVYEGARQAASTFNAIQLGLTFVCFVESEKGGGARQANTSGEYKTFTVSIPINPWFATDEPVLEKMAEVIDRQISFSQASVLALKRHGIYVEEMIRNGLPYLGRQEIERIEREMLHDKEHDHIDPKTDGPWALDFYNKLREEVSDWLNSTQKLGSTGMKFRVFDPQGAGILRMTTVKLVHQLIREEFTTLRCYKDRTDVAMTIRPITEEDIQNSALQEKRVRQKIQEQLGISRLVEVLFDLDLRCTATGNKYTQDFSTFEAEVDIEFLDTLGIRHKESMTGLVRRAQRNRPVLIGHNVLHDLCFLYATFSGPLPANVWAFHSLLQQACIRIFDTKVMAATMTDPDAVDETLEDLFKTFGLQDNPRTRTLPGWGYNVQNRSVQYNRPVAHEAGFDSFMTAIVFLKTSFRQLELQKGSPDGYGGPDPWLKDSARGDHSLYPRATQVSDRLPHFDSPFFKPVANKLRMSTVGVLDLATSSPLRAHEDPRHGL